MEHLGPGHPLLEAVSTHYSQGQGKITRNLGQAREYLEAIPDGWAKLDGKWFHVVTVRGGRELLDPEGEWTDCTWLAVGGQEGGERE